MFRIGIRSEYEIIGLTLQQLNNYEGNVCEIFSYHNRSLRKTFLFHTFAILSFGLLYVVVSWYPQLITTKMTKCTLNIADVLLVKDLNGNYELINIKKDLLLVQGSTLTNIKYFIYRHDKYIFDENEGLFKSLNDFLPKLTLSDILEKSTGIAESEKNELKNLFGQNSVNVDIKSYWDLFVNEVFNPFYVFQLFSIILWCVDDYIVYALCVLLLTMLSIVTTLRETRKQNMALHKLIKSSASNTATILRPNPISNYTEHDIEAVDIVPGDLLIIPRSGCIMPCDAVLLTGHCIVNESMLSGESTPITKTPPHLSSEVYDINIHKKYTLFSGTHILQARYYGGEYVLARAIKTGFNTMKGELVKSILYPVPVNLKFYKDSMKFLFSLAIIAVTGMGYCIYLYHKRGVDIEYIVIRTLDIITIVVPPALPAAMTIGVAYSQSRLKNLNIFCISPPRINLAGKVKLACFDKTGTLTEDGLELKLIVPSIDGKLLEPQTNVSKLDEKRNLVKAMATCHSLTRIDGQLTGDPLDMSMFESTKWQIEEPGEEENTRFDNLAPIIVKPPHYGCNVVEDEISYGIGIIRQFPFSSTQQCMTVICRELGDSCMISFSKGAPERIKSFCRQESLPSDFISCLSHYTSQGFRVIALSCKKLSSKFKWKDSQKVKREVIECEMTFLGFVVLQNSLKSETFPVIRSLHNANIYTVMITGDNIMTAISVARDCNMVKGNEPIILVKVESENDQELPKMFFEVLDKDMVVDFYRNKYHLAMDGYTWNNLREYYSDYLPHILVRSTIFARFQPDQKTQLINQLQKIEYVVSMVGDGANDCGALKAAHVGVSLSQAEASVAAPFTSSKPDISCIVHLILEGRCTLVTSFALFKYMAFYSLIQFFSVLILYTNNSMLGDTQYLFIDLIITTSLAVSIGHQGPARKLQPDRPMGSLICARNLIPLVVQIILCLAVQLGSYFYLRHQTWFIPLPAGKEEVIVCWENTVIFIVSTYQYIIMAVVYAKGKPFRQRLITNFWFLLSAVSLVCFLTWLFLYPERKVAEFFEMIYLSGKRTTEQEVFRDTLLILPLIHFILAAIIEVAIADRKWFKKFLHYICMKRKPKNKYKILLERNILAQWLNSPEFNVSLSSTDS